MINRRVVILAGTTALAWHVQSARAQSTGVAFDHAYAAWDALLKKHVRWLPDGKQSKADYKGFAADRAALQTVLSQWSAPTPAQFGNFSREQKMAFLINAYNGFTGALSRVVEAVHNLEDLMYSIRHQPLASVATLVLTMCATAVIAQTEEPLCVAGVKPALSAMTLHWNSFNMFGNRKETYMETGYKQVGDGKSCKISAVRDGGKATERPCTWNLRLSCELQLNKSAVTHSFSAGSYQYGKLQWVGNEPLAVKIKRGESTTDEARTVAIVKFNGTWSNGPNRGDSVATMYFDREWGILLKVEGAHDQNLWGDTVTLVEVKP